MKTLSHLILLRLVSHSHAMMILGLLNIIFLILISHDHSIHGDIHATLTAMVVIPLLLSLLVIGVIVQGDVKERRTRHFTELPISNSQVRLSFWGLVSGCLALTTVIWVLFIASVVKLSPFDLCKFMLLFFVHAVVLTELTVLILRYVNPRAKWQRQVWGGAGALVIFLVAGPFYTAVMEGGNVNWSLLLGVLMPASLFLAWVDIYLYRRSTDFLN